MLRKQCRYSECRDLDLKNETVFSESHTSEFSRELAVAYYDSGNLERAYKLMKRTDMPEARAKIDTGRLLSADLLKDCNDFAIINTGPTMVCDYVLHEMIPDMASVMWLSPPHALYRLKHKAEGPVYFLPEGIFDYENDIEKIDPAVFHFI